ncbi:multidrug effflux MFS transporter [Aquipseudomonas ullengensis]|uniref:Bcr/CflA family efflux transporter n=1 Tax=Aquipseudomonas ullengensis TaxID=2759166 RepID=A0A7W4LN40_9GAMM|nr:multidrug effflux MFS transporter [Pseudomonas ullengensis]MBB2496178.1 multidrug effflux MFS transporter [Pseudomonas ullengensis]
MQTVERDHSTPVSEPMVEKAQPELTRRLLLLLAGFAALGALATNIILPAFPQIASDLNASFNDLGATLSSFFVAFALGQLVVGPLSDRFGRKPLVLGGIATFVLGCAVCALATSLPQLITGRTIQALGVCATSVLSRAIARDLFDGDQLARTLALIMVAMAAAPGFSPLLGGAFEQLLGWRATFGFVAAVAILLGGYYVVSLGETHAKDYRTAPSIQAVLLGYKRLLLDRRFIAPALTVSLVVGTLYAFFSMAPAILMAGFGLSSLDLGVFFAATVFVVFAAGLSAPRLVRRWGQVAVARTGIVIAFAGSLGLLIAPHSFLFFCVFLTIFLLGMGVVNPLGTAIALHPFGAQAGAASALLGFLQMGCAAAAITLGTSLSLSAYASLAVISVAALTASFIAFLAAR